MNFHCLRIVVFINLFRQGSSILLSSPFTLALKSMEAQSLYYVAIYFSNFFYVFGILNINELIREGIRNIVTSPTSISKFQIAE
jgi:hypothetical protein